MTTRYTQDHEYVRFDGDAGIVGISNHAQEQLGDIVFVELPEIGKKLKKGDEAAVVESVKAASEVYAPVSGTVIEVNEALNGDPSLVNSGAEDGGWMFKLSLADKTELDALMDADTYAAHAG